jgi:cbb3-type cytochrome oxidase cytochrome c subunit
MADRGDTHYSVPTLNKWFLVSSVALLGAVVWMVLDDWNRPWKTYQREFREIELAKARAEEELLTKAGALEAETRLQEQVAQAEATLASRESELAAAKEELRLAKGDLWNAIESAKKVLSAFNWDRYVIEEERRKLGDPAYRKDELVASEFALNNAKGVQEELQAKKDAAESKVNGLLRDVSQAQAALASGTRDLARVRGRLVALDRGSMSGPEKLADVIRDAPGLDFVKPSLTVNKVVLDRLTFELNFTKKKRIDMCQTCHMGIDRSGFEDEAQPFASHPRLDLFVTNKSPHPANQFGCTICHRGSGEALDFVRADHRPNDKDQAADWFGEHHWHKQHHWDYPMLSSSFTEASCVQCHKTSMDLIAEDAPTVSEGYQLVERYGCYSCHKIDWFPTKRRPGPTLTNLQAKLSPEFIASWITNPKDFRPTTWMPQFFHLENYAPGETVAISKYGQGRAIEGREWDDAAVSAITAFLQSRAPKKPLPAPPVAGDAHRGRETMRLVGCLACHNMAPFGEEPAEANDLALEKRGTNEHGPNLRGVATKVSPEWLFAWLKDPKSYWAETRMPNLRLSDQEAADITAYMMEDPDGIFRDVPEGWEAKDVALPEAQLHEVLGEHARWQFARDGRAAIEARLEGRDDKARWNDLAELKVAVGEKLVAQYGCFSCHEIEGMQDWMPIGTELSNWGSKTVDKLDFGPGAGEFGLDANYREGWLMQKLHAPRSYDRKKIKNPTERLRMPYFSFTDEQVQAITTFVVGLVDNEVQLAKMEPTHAQLAMDAGMRAVRQNNCVACHMVDPGTVTFEDESGVQRTIAAELLNFEEQAVPSAHDLAAVKADAEKFEAEEVAFRVLRNEPEIGKKPGDKVFVPVSKLVALGAPNGGDLVRLVADYYYGGVEVHDPSLGSGDDAFRYESGATEDGEFGVTDADGKVRDHSGEPYDKVRWTFAPPVLWNEGGKLQRNWFFSFLKDVVPLRPQLRVRMPSFDFDSGEAEAIADYFAHKSANEWPAEFTRAFRLARGLSAADAARECGVSEAVLLEIENGGRAATKANFDKVEARIRAAKFESSPAVDPAYEITKTRTAAYLAQRRAEDSSHLARGESLAVQAVNCFQCHFRLGQPPPADPIAWAPDLNHTRERLREDWVYGWLTDPSLVYPGTAMPANFGSNPPQYQDHYPSSTNPDQVRVVLEWLYNFDRMYIGQ